MMPREIDLEDTMLRNRMSKAELDFMLGAAEAAGKVFSRVDHGVVKYFWIEDDNDRGEQGFKQGLHR